MSVIRKSLSAVLDKAISQRRKECKDLLKSLIRQDTINPPGNEYRAANIIKRFLKKDKIRFKVYAKDKKRPNILAEVGKGKPVILIATHLDVVPVGEGWKLDPFKPVEKNKRIYGRGSSDNKGAVASSLIAASILKRNESRLKKRFIFAFLSDEERGNEYGIDFLLKKGVIKADFAIIPDIGGNLDKIDIGEKGYLDIKVTSLGKQAHSSDPDKGVNALANLAEFITLLKRFRMRYRKDRIFSPPTIVPSVMGAGSAPNIVPGKAELIINIRYLPSQDHKKIISELKLLSKKVKNARFRFTVTQHMLPHKLRVSSSIMKLRRMMRKITGKNPKLTGLSGGTFAKPLNLKGVRAVGIGCSPEHVHHMADEYIEVRHLDDLVSLIVFYAFD